MDQLATTYQEAISRPYSSSEQDLFRGLLPHPLAACGVGGSFTAAEYAARLHRYCTGQSSRSVTTLDVLTEGIMQNEAFLLASAGGRNKDVLRTIEAVLAAGIREAAILTANPKSPLGHFVENAGFPLLFDLKSTTKKDGFLATNTLLATLIHIARLYQEACSLAFELPTSLHRCLGSSMEELRTSLKANQDLAKPELIVLHAGWGKIAATDLEARLHESAMRTVHVADLRNFGHGRHFALERRGSRTTVIIFTDSSHERLAKATARVFPTGVPTLTLAATTSGPIAAIELVVKSMLITEAIGAIDAIDPGRPTVPSWGRRLYSLGPSQAPTLWNPNRKLPQAWRHGEWTLPESNPLEQRPIKAAVLDVDGTLLERRNRRGSPDKAILDEIRRLLGDGLVLGFATGRGKSLHREVLAEGIPREHLGRVILGYYNGAIIKQMDEHPLDPVSDGKRPPDLELMRHLLAATNRPEWFKMDDKSSHQIGVVPVNPGDAARLQELVRSEIDAHELDLGVGTSSLGTDIFDGRRGKMRVVDRVASVARCSPDEVIRIGDMGHHGGNDYDLLNHPFGLTVARSSASLSRCLVPLDDTPRGPMGTLHLLKSIQKIDEEHRLMGW